MPICEHCAVEIRRRPVDGRAADAVYCTRECRKLREDHPELHSFPAEFLAEKVRSAHLGNCPACGGDGPIDLHRTHRIFSFFLFSSFATRDEIGCARCGRKNRLVDALICLFCGPWSIPWGIAGTPIQIARNLADIGAPVRRNKPSRRFRLAVIEDLAHRALYERQQEIHRQAKQRDS